MEWQATFDYGWFEVHWCICVWLITSCMTFLLTHLPPNTYHSMAIRIFMPDCTLIARALGAFDTLSADRPDETSDRSIVWW